MLTRFKLIERIQIRQKVSNFAVAVAVAGTGTMGYDPVWERDSYNGALT